MQRLKDAGLWHVAVSGEEGGETNDNGLILPVAHIFQRFANLILM
jgi:hypothetical protein